MNSIVDDLKYRFKNGDAILRLLYVNIGAFLVLVIMSLFNLEGFYFEWLAFKINDFWHIAIKPYTIITHMFVHSLNDPMHIVFNMLVLFYTGKMFLMYFSQKQLVGLYFMGGIIGAVGLFVVALVSPLFNGEAQVLGASAAIMAIVLAISTYQPNMRVNLFGLIPVKLIYVGIGFVVMDILYLKDSNTGGHVAHLIGAMVGWWFTTSIRKGKDITAPVNAFIDKVVNLFKPRQKMKVEYSSKDFRKMSDEDYNYTTKVTQEQIDEILDKISRSGYDSLSKKEKEILFKYSKK